MRLLTRMQELVQVIKVDEYLDARALQKNRLFAQLLQALIGLAQAASEERSVLESLSNQEQRQPRLQNT